MAKSKGVVLSQNPFLTSDLPARLDGSFDFYTCDNLTHVEQVAVENDARALLVDLQRISDGGHAQAELLEKLQSQLPKLEIVLLTDEECPEPLERVAACTRMHHLRGKVDIGLIAEWLEGTRAEVSNDEQLATFSAEEMNEPEPDTAMHGISRAFHTNSPRLKKMLDELEVAAQHDVTTLLIGETGSGKTFLSSLIHEVSPRRNQPFLPVACGALPADLIESELFGHVKGAFTSAHADKEGKFIAAGRGTILLDEIDVLGPVQQVKLLRVIETGEFEPVGSNTTYKSQARLVVASNLQLQPLVEQAKFRPDLYYRLNQLKFEIPPLRDRKCDIPVLAKKFIKQASEKHKIPINHIDESLLTALYNFTWHGNVRELENVIQRAVIFCRDGQLSAEHLPEHVIDGIAGPMNDPSAMPPQPHPATDSANKLDQQMALTEREIIEQTLFKNNFSRTKTAKDLGISRVTLYNKMKKYGI